jgi:hypothetical protein
MRTETLEIPSGDEAYIGLGADSFKVHLKIQENSTDTT